MLGKVRGQHKACSINHHGNHLLLKLEHPDMTGQAARELRWSSSLHPCISGVRGAKHCTYLLSRHQTKILMLTWWALYPLSFLLSPWDSSSVCWSLILSWNGQSSYFYYNYIYHDIYLESFSRSLIFISCLPWFLNSFNTFKLTFSSRVC